MSKYFKCINNTSNEHCLTSGKVYKVINKDNWYFTTINDNGLKDQFFVKRFIEITGKLVGVLYGR